ncbi:hypothetical protein [Zobellella sp. An-6]|uniref:hypothetical protein n=1 Tax=Zobellella sp. An-6 TaxID=3400218 RepID=UPI0040412F29
MAKIQAVVLQGVSYFWNGQSIVVDDGINLPWSLPGNVLEQVELFDEEGEPTAAFSIDFEHQQWSLWGQSGPGEVVLLDETGERQSLLAVTGVDDLLLQDGVLLALPDRDNASDSPSELVLPDLDDILDEVMDLDETPSATVPDTAGLSSELIDDVINWLAVYHHHD